MNFDDLLNQTAVYWAPGGNDGFGKVSFVGVTPVEVSCRWQPSSKLFRDAKGKEFVSSAVVYSAVELAIGGRLVRSTLATVGTGVTPAQVSASEVRHVGESPPLQGSGQSLFKYMLT